MKTKNNTRGRKLSDKHFSGYFLTSYLYQTHSIVVFYICTHAKSTNDEYLQVKH